MKALHEIALVGTAHLADEARAALASGLPTDALLSALAEDVSLERRVLVSAALQSIALAAGAASRADVPPLPIAPPEPRPPCGPRVAELIREIASTAPALLREALSRLHAAGQVVPPVLIPDLLSTRQDGLASAIADAIGERGKWFCSLSGRGDSLGADATEAEARTTWQEGKHVDRLAALAARRRTAPAEARAWLEETWANEKAEPRAEFLEALAEGLAAEDVDFLERALSDRSAGVRAVAAGLLSRLPASPTAERAARRADALLAYETAAPAGLLSRARSMLSGGNRALLRVEPPSAFDPAWEREGIAAKPPKGVGEKAHWLGELLALVAPAHWQERFGAPPAELVRAAAPTDWATSILLGWSRAALRQGDAAWIAALWDGWRDLSLEPSLGVEVTLRTRLLGELLHRMAPADAEERVLALASANVTGHPLEPAAIIDAVAPPWSREFSDALLRHLRRHLEEAASQSWAPGTWFDALVPLASGLHPSGLPAAIGLEDALSSRDITAALQRRLEEFRQLIQLRHRIHEEIRP